MGFFYAFKIKWMWRKIEKIESIVSPLIVKLALKTEKEVLAGVTSWDLENKILLLFLGYIAGAIDAAEYVLYGKQGKPRKGVLLIDCLFLKCVHGIFSSLPNASVFLDIEQQSLFSRTEGGDGQGAISGMQDFEFFRIGQKHGANDLFALIEGGQKFDWDGLNYIKLLMEAVLEVEGGEVPESDHFSESVEFSTQQEADSYADFVKSDPYVSEVRLKKKGDAWVVLVRSVD